MLILYWQGGTTKKCFMRSFSRLHYILHGPLSVVLLQWMEQNLITQLNCVCAFTFVVSPYQCVLPLPYVHLGASELTSIVFLFHPIVSSQVQCLHSLPYRRPRPFPL
jgi:hypothetical protein